MSDAFTIDGSNWTYRAKANELAKAYSERYYAIYHTFRTWNGTAWSNSATNVDLADEIDIQHYLFWSTMQEFVEDECGKFVPNATAGYYDESATIQTIQELADDDEEMDSAFHYLCANIISGAMIDDDGNYGFRAWVETESIFEYRAQLAGDVICGIKPNDGEKDWLFEDLVSCYAVLLATRVGSGLISVIDQSYKAGYGNDVEWDIALDDAFADYSPATSAGLPQQYQYRLINGNPPDDGYYECTIRGRIGKFQIDTSGSILVSGTVDFYMLPTAFPEGYVTNLSYSEDVFNLITTIVKSETNTTSSEIGNLTLPSAMEAYVPYPVTDNGPSGWYVPTGNDGRLAVIRWDFTNG